MRNRDRGFPSDVPGTFRDKAKSAVADRAQSTLMLQTFTSLIKSCDVFGCG
jgi:hypothetical protein